MTAKKSDPTAYGFIKVQTAKMREPLHLTFIDYDEYYALYHDVCAKYGAAAIVERYWGYSIHTRAKALEDIAFWARDDKEA